MGSNLSTLVVGTIETMSRETMIGVLLAIPIFVQYFKQHMEAFQKDPTQIVSTLQSMSTLQYTTEDSEVAVVKHRSLMCGVMPPSSDHSISTIQMSNYERDFLSSSVPTKVPHEVHLNEVPVTPLATEEPAMEAVPILAIEVALLSVSPEVVKSQPPSLPVLEPETPSYASSATPEKTRDYEVTPKSKRPMATITVVTPETVLAGASDCGLDSSQGSESESTTPKTTSEYLESVSRSLIKRARKAAHSDKVGIAHALVELGDILLQDCEYKSAMGVYKRAELLQKVIIDETMTSVASALGQQAEYHNKHGNTSLSKIYAKMCKELQARPTPINLQKCIKVHHDYRPHGHVDKEYATLMKKLDRRLKRAGAEAVPLVATLKKQATCASAR